MMALQGNSFLGFEIEEFSILVSQSENGGETG